MKNKSMWDGVLRACGLAPVIGARGAAACQTRLDAPTRPAPPMPECKPAAPDLRTTYQIIAACVEDSVTHGDVSINKARMALHQAKVVLPREMGGWADSRPAGAVTVDGQNINPAPTGKRPPAPPPPPPIRRIREDQPGPRNA